MRYVEIWKNMRKRCWKTSEKTLSCKSIPLVFVNGKWIEDSRSARDRVRAHHRRPTANLSKLSKAAPDTGRSGKGGRRAPEYGVAFCNCSSVEKRPKNPSKNERTRSSIATIAPSKRWSNRVLLCSLAYSQRNKMWNGEKNHTPSNIFFRAAGCRGLIDTLVAENVLGQIFARCKAPWGLDICRETSNDLQQDSIVVINL